MAPAKLNLTLELGDLRPDGFHEVRTYLVKLDWGDTVRMASHRAVGNLLIAGGTVAERIRFAVRGAPAPRGRRNLVVQALERWFPEDPNLRRVRVELRKRIPAGTGLGGGSSDAGTVLGALMRQRARDLGRPEPVADAPWVEALGADVPFFVSDCVGAVGSGRGGELKPGPGLPVAWPVVLVFPPMALATARVYGRAGQTRAEAEFGRRTERVRALLDAAGGWASSSPSPSPSGAGLGPRAPEVFEELAYLTGSELSVAAFSLEPRLRQVWDALVRALPGHRPCGMTGSGSALYAILASVDEAVHVTRAMRRVGLPSRIVRGLGDERPFARAQGLVP